MNIIEFLKNGSGIHIKPSQRGSFTKYCNGKVTEECIRRGKNSPDPKIRKKATFAQNARRWKHKEGGKAFVTGVSVLDSNPDAYKYVKKKYKMRSAQQGTKLDQFFSSDLGQFAISTIGQLYDGIKSQSNYNKFQKLNKERIKSGKEAIINNVGDVSQEATEYLNQLKLQNPDVNYSSVDLGQIQQLITNKRKLENMQKANQWELDQLQQQNSQINAIQGNSGIRDILSKGLGLIGDYYSNKNSTKNNYVKSSIKNQFSGSMLNTDPKTFFNLT